MGKLIDKNDKIQIIHEKGGFKIAPYKCKLLDNLLIYRYDGKINYNTDLIYDNIPDNGELVTLPKYAYLPNDNYGIFIRIECKLFDKPCKIIVCNGEHAEYTEPLSTNMIDVLNIIIEAMYTKNTHTATDALAIIPELSNINGVSAMSSTIILEHYNKGNIDKALDELKICLCRDDINETDLKQFKKDIESKWTVETYLKSLELDDNQYILIEVTRDSVVKRPVIKDYKINYREKWD